jgi:phospholipase D1/2
MKLRGVRWLQAALLLLPLTLLAAAWKWTDLHVWAQPDRLAETFEPYRTSWLAAPVIVLVFVVAELFLFPVFVLIFVCGAAFGPWLGTIYALVGSIASTLIPFFLGRKLGRRRLERIGGATMRLIETSLAKRGVVAVFLVRKIPAPFTLVNMACGAAPLSLRDFVYGTLLGMGTAVVLVTVLGGRLIEIARDPTPAEIALSVGIVVVPVVPALLLQRAINRRMEARG